MRPGTPLLLLSLLSLLPLTAAAQPIIYDIPRLNRLVIDGEAADWKDDGFRIEALAPTDGRIRPTTEFDAAVRVGWRARAAHLDNNQQGGLLVLVSVVDAILVESVDPHRLTDGDCVQIAATSDISNAFTRFAISPGLDADRAALRVAIDGHAHPLPSTAVTAAARRTRAGYMVEAFIPMPASNTTGVTVNVAVHDADARGRGAVRHTAAPVATEESVSDRGLPLRFSLQASEPRTYAVASGPHDLRRGFVTIVAPAEAVDKVVEVGSGGSIQALGTAPQPDAPRAAGTGVPAAAVAAPPTAAIVLPVAHGPIARRADRAGVTLTYPLPPILGVRQRKPERKPPFNVYLGPQKIAEIPVPNLDRQRRSALARMDVRFAATVFAGDAFPSCDLDDPAAARDLIGPYEIRPTFYNARHEQVDRPDQPGRYGAVVRIVPENPNVELPPRCLTLFKLKGKTDWTEDELRPRIALPPQLGVDPKVVDEQQAALTEEARWILADRLPADPDTPLLLAALADAKPGGSQLAGQQSIWAQDQRWWFPLKQKLGLEKYKYHVDRPPYYGNGAIGGKKFPLLLFLHGSGERGDDLEQVQVYGPGRALVKTGHVRRSVRTGRGVDADEWAPFVTVSPQCPPGEWWSAPQLDLLLRNVQSQHHIDPDRVYVTGLSMGGYGAWELAAEYPTRFAAIAPVCGAGSPEDADRLKHLPTWIFHGQRDPVVPFARGTLMFEALKKAGGRVRFTPYPELGHDAWTRTYENPDLYDWLLAQKRGDPNQPPATPTP
jgi:pimeloyl-ACP methyl ester carboxylesterase